MKKGIISIIGFIVSILVASNVLATTSLKANVNTVTKDVKAGQEVVLKLKLDEFQEMAKGVNAYKATLDYNKEVFEQVKQENLVTLNGWEQLEYHPETEELVAIKRAGSKTPEEVLMITLKVKQNAKPQETEIKIKDMVTSEGKEDLFVPETSIKVNVVKEQTQEPNKPVTPVNPEQPGNNGNHGGDSNDSNNNINQPGKLPNNQGNGGITGTISNPPSNGGKGDSQDDGTTATKTFPKTGNKQRKIALMIALAVEILLIVAYVSKKKGKEIDLEINRRTKAMIATLVVSIVSLQAMGTIYAAVSSFVTKGELNDDGEINYSDVHLLELHLIHKQDLPDDKLEKADMNNDEKLTVTDLTLLIQKIERTLDYQVQLSDTGLENYYPNKNQDINLKFDASVSYDANVKKVVVNGQEYEVQKVEGANHEYTFKTNTGNVAGIKEYHFKEVLLDNEKRVKVDYTLKIDVLKEKPTIENYITEDNINEQKIKVSFDLVDQDNSTTSAKLEILDDTEKVIQEQEIEKGQNQVEVAVPEGKKYKINFVLRYDLDSNQLQPEEDNTGMEQITKELQMVIDYNLKVTNITTKKEDQVTTIFEKNQPIQLAFESTNSTIHEPTKIKVNGKEYAVTKKDNQYMVTIDAMAELGEKEIVIEEVVLANGKKVTLESENKTTIKVIKQKPTVTEFTTEENIEQNNMKISFSLKDEDKTIKKASVILLDAEEKEIGREELSQEEIENAGKIEKTLTTKITSKYKVKVMATYNQTGVDTEDIADTILLEQEIKAEPRATIKEGVSNKHYVEKGETVTITYDVETNKTEAISKIRVSNTDCQVTKLENGKYQVTLTVNEESGVQELRATKIIYSDDTMANVSHTIKVDVLKNKPSIENYKQLDDTDHAQVTLNFDLNDEDDSIIKAKAVLTKQDDSTIKEEKELQIGANNITFTVENAKLYTLEIKVTYDRDTNTLEGKPEEDNRVTDEIFATKEILVLSDYELQISNIKTYKGTTESKYFKKDEGITLKFESTNISKFVPVKAVINGKEYQLTKVGNTYETSIDSYAEAGVKDIVIEKITLDNTKELQVTESNQTKIEILKDKPTATNFGYQENENGTLTATFQIVDEEDTLTGGKVIVYGQDNTVVKQENIVKGTNTIDFIVNASDNEFYTLKVLANYDLDTNTLDTVSNEHQDVELLNEIINVGKRLIEMKDITNIALYRKTANTVKEVTSLSKADLANLNEYIVKVDMEQLDSFYAPVKEYKIENNEMKFVLDYDDHVQYVGSEKKNKLEVTYGIIKNGVAQNQNLQELIEAIRANPSGSFELYKDYDLSGITILDDNTEFTGTLNGNGHILSNLTTRLFNKTNGATIENLVIQDSSLTAFGTLMNECSNTTIKNVHLKNITLTAPNANGTGGLIGKSKENSIIENCSITNISVGSNKRIGGMIGLMYASTMRNCYITGKVSSNNDAAGGVIGEAYTNSMVQNLYADVTTNFSWTDGSIGGFIGNPVGITLTNCISLAKAQTDAHGKRVYGSYNNSQISTASRNVYELSTSNMKPNKGNRGIQELTPETLMEKDFYTQVLGWDEEIWDMSKVQNGEYPTLKSDPILSAKKEEQPNNPDLYIPDYSRIHKIINYDEDREMAYYNMYQLMPFYDAKYYVEDGNKIAKDHVLNTKKIKHIFAYDANGKWIGALSQKQKDTIKTIRILFTDDDSVTYPVSYKEDTSKIVHYKIDELGIEYNYDKYLINTDSPVYTYIVNQTKAYDYVNDIASLTPETEVRNYTENYPHVKQNAEKFALYLLANSEEYNVSIANSVLESKIVQDLSTDHTLQKLLYGYNYFDRFYNVEIGGINMTDIAYFDGSIFNERLHATMTSKNLVERATQNDRATANLTVFYNSYIKPYTGRNIGNFLEYFMQNLTTEKYKDDPASWIVDNYNGAVYEAPAPRFTEIRYRVWDHLKARDMLILPILSYHGEDIYVLGIPTCVLVGNLDSGYYIRNGFHKNSFSETTKEERVAFLKSFADNACTWYDSVAGVVNEKGYNNMKNRTMINYDNTANKNWSNDPNVKPVFKAFNEVLNKYIIHNAASAYANGTDIYWIYDTLSFYNIYTHEAVHNQDGRTFLDGYGRRTGGGAEHFTDNFLTQGLGQYGVVPNYTYTGSIMGAYTTNITKDRINTREKIGTYYKGMYDTFALLDYIEAQAFLQLTPEEQSRIAQVLEGTSYVWKTANDFKAMNLRTMQDILDHNLLIIRGGKAYTTGSLWTIYENPNVGAAPKGFFVLNAYQFLADYGYDGYVAYASNRYGTYTDKQIIEMLSDGRYHSFKEYQKGRYENVKNHLSAFRHLNVQDTIKNTYEAMKLDVAQNMPVDLNSYASTYREGLYGYLKRITNDFETSIYKETPNLVHITSAQQLVTELREHPEKNVILDRDIDFTNIPVEDETQYMIENFVGTFNGNGHKIIGLVRPLFGNVIFTNVKNVTIENANVVTNYNTAGILAKKIDFSVIENVTLKNTSITGTNTIGGIAGTINRSTVKNIVYNNTTVETSNNSNYIGGLFGQATYTTIKNVHGINATVQGRHRVGGIVGNANFIYELTQSTFNGNIVSTNNSVGGLAGYILNSNINNSYVLGNITANAYVGGAIGDASSVKLDKVFSNATVRGNASASTGGLIGSLSDAASGKKFNTSVTNSLALGHTYNGYKFVSNSTKEVIESCYQNNYEFEEINGMSTLSKAGINFENKITEVAMKDFTVPFYTLTLGWKSDIWDFTNVTRGGLPKLRNLDPNNVDVMIEKIEIDSVEDFLKINEEPSKIYKLTKDIDFTSFTLEEGDAVITQNFTGKIEGNGHTISNLTNASLFANFRGTVKDLNIRNFTNEGTGNATTAFAQNSSSATFKNMTFDHITLNGTHRVAVVVGTDQSNSVFEKITVKNARVKGTGVYVSNFIGRKYGGKVTNCYVQGTLECYTTECGGIIGALHDDGTIENVVSNVAISRPRSTDSRNNNGGVIGNIINNTSIVKNSISIGNMTGFTANGAEVNVKKFVGCSEEMIKSCLTNCYELTTATGASSITSNTSNYLKAATSQNLRDKNFYKNTLKFDETVWNLDRVVATGYPELK